MSETATTTATVHESKYGTYHPAPAEEIAWTINDTRGYIDGGPSCDECGACECEGCPCKCAESCEHDDESECIGLSFAFVCLDGGESLCPDCAEKAGLAIVPCNCPE